MHSVIFIIAEDMEDLILLSVKPLLLSFHHLLQPVVPWHLVLKSSKLFVEVHQSCDAIYYVLFNFVIWARNPFLDEISFLSSAIDYSTKT